MIVEKFCEDIKSFYCEQSSSTGYITAKNRNGVLQQFPFMTVSDAIICHGFGHMHDLDDNELNEIFGYVKKSAKLAKSHICCIDLGVAKVIDWFLKVVVAGDGIEPKSLIPKISILYYLKRRFKVHKKVH